MDLLPVHGSRLKVLGAVARCVSVGLIILTFNNPPCLGLNKADGEGSYGAAPASILQLQYLSPARAQRSRSSEARCASIEDPRHRLRIGREPTGSFCASFLLHGWPESEASAETACSGSGSSFPGNDGDLALHRGNLPGGRAILDDHPVNDWASSAISEYCPALLLPRGPTLGPTCVSLGPACDTRTACTCPALFVGQRCTCTLPSDRRNAAGQQHARKKLRGLLVCTTRGHVKHMTRSERPVAPYYPAFLVFCFMQPSILPLIRQLLLCFWFDDYASIWVFGSSFFYLRRRHKQHSSVAGMFLLRWLHRPTLHRRYTRPIHPGARVLDASANTPRWQNRPPQRFSRRCCLSFRSQDRYVPWSSFEDLYVLWLF